MVKIDRKLLEDAIAAFGVDLQIDHAIEEMGELIVALMELKRNRGVKTGRIDAVLTELADVRIMIDQLILIFGEGATQQFIDSKSEYLSTLINEWRTNNYG